MKYAQVKTSLPGPIANSILSKGVVANSFNSMLPTVIDHASGAIVVDKDGNQFIDLAGGVGSLNVGHSHPRVVKAVQEAVKRFTHTDYTVIPYESFVDLAEELCLRMPGDFRKKACLFNSGTEAVESAIHIAKAATNKRSIICFEGAFHGRTLMSLSLTSKIQPYKRGLGSFAPDVYRAPYPYTYRWPHAIDEEQVADEAFHRFESLFVTHAPLDDTAAVIIEAIQGEGGFIVPPAKFLHKIESFCREHGILLIVDEVQTGYGRTGEFLASDYFGITPDIITLGKSIAGGMPLSAVVGREDVMEAAGPGRIGGTFVGNPLSCSSALEVLRIYDEECLGERARMIGEYIADRLEHFYERFELVGEVRGVGAMRAIELVRNRETKEPADTETTEIIERCMRRGVILFRAGIHNNVIRFLNPLTIEMDQLEEAMDILEDVQAQVNRKYTVSV